MGYNKQLFFYIFLSMGDFRDSLLTGVDSLLVRNYAIPWGGEGVCVGLESNQGRLQCFCAGTML